jgi:hypothetical protein
MGAFLYVLSYKTLVPTNGRYFLAVPRRVRLCSELDLQPSRCYGGRACYDNAPVRVRKAYAVCQ